MSSLGFSYLLGQGVPQDNKKAYSWFSLGAMSGDAISVKFRDEVASKLTPQGLEEAQTLAAQYQKKIDENNKGK